MFASKLKSLTPGSSKSTSPVPLDGDTTLNPGIHYEYTNNHPLGKLLLKVLHDNTQLAKKTGLKTMELGIDDLCTSFYNAQLLERNRMKNSILQTTAGIEMSMIEKEMNWLS